MQPASAYKRACVESPRDLHRRMVAALRQPARYPASDFPPGVERPECLDLVETHISSVILAGGFAYKLKKPVDLGFLDFTTLEARKFYCEEELRLNRRTAPSLYLDVVPVTGSHDDPRLGGPGPVIDYALRMLRFSQDRLLDRLAAKGALHAKEMEDFALSLSRFHANAPRADPAGRYASCSQIGETAIQNFSQVEQLLCSSRQTAALRAWTAAQLARLAPVFAARLRGGFVRECHGDLHLGNLVMLDGVVTAFDCLEFSAQLRWEDVMSEVGFLMMDLEAHGLREHAIAFLNRYLEATGDYEGLDVLRFYMVYRAMVRAKVACVRAHQDDADTEARARSGEEFARYLEFAERAARPARGAFILMHGLSGSGKSTIAKSVAGTLHAIHLRSDLERKRLEGLMPLARSGSGVGAGIYGFSATERTYGRLAELATRIASAGYPVIVDATFLDRRHRDRFRALAGQAGFGFGIVSCVAPHAILRQRLLRREAAGSDPSEANAKVLEHQIACSDALAPEERPAILEVDTSLDPRVSSKAASAMARRLGFDCIGMT